MFSKRSLWAGKRAVPLRCHPEPMCESYSVPRQHRCVWTQRTGETPFTPFTHTNTKTSITSRWRGLKYRSMDSFQQEKLAWISFQCNVRETVLGLEIMRSLWGSSQRERYLETEAFGKGICVGEMPKNVWARVGVAFKKTETSFQG